MALYTQKAIMRTFQQMLEEMTKTAAGLMRSAKDALASS